MDIAADWIAGGALLVAAVSATFAWAAGRRAKDALDLQTRIDERAREFRDVRWSLEWATEVPSAGGVRVRLSNVGLSDARSVSLVIGLPEGDRVFQVASIDHGATAEIEIYEDDSGRGVVRAAVLDRQDLPWRVHWSSPLGEVGFFDHPGVQIF